MSTRAGSRSFTRSWEKVDRVRIWTLHPRYLDARGLLALWRETLLAQKVLRGRTRGYRHHPQLARFKAQPDPVAAVATYLSAVAAEARGRGYQFASSKIAAHSTTALVAATRGQLRYEWAHLKRKLRQRDPARYRAVRSLKMPRPHPLFRIVPGGVEPWEVIS
jgi:hypothetical protein